MSSVNDKRATTFAIQWKIGSIDCKWHVYHFSKRHTHTGGSKTLHRSPLSSQYLNKLNPHDCTAHIIDRMCFCSFEETLQSIIILKYDILIFMNECVGKHVTTPSSMLIIISDSESRQQLQHVSASQFSSAKPIWEIQVWFGAHCTMHSPVISFSFICMFVAFCDWIFIKMCA